MTAKRWDTIIREKQSAAIKKWSTFTYFSNTSNNFTFYYSWHNWCTKQAEQKPLIDIMGFCLGYGDGFSKMIKVGFAKIN